MNLQYKQEVSKYGKKDAIIALGVFLFFIVLLQMVGIVNDSSREALTSQQRFLIRGLMSFAGVIPVFAIILIKKQGFSSIGIHKEKMLPALRIGLLFSFIPLTLGILPGLLYGAEFVGFGTLLFSLFVTFLFAAAEDVCFVGFLQTRMYGLFKTDKVAISLVAAMFSFMHVPAWLRTGQLSFDNLLYLGIALITWFILHLALVSIFRRYFALAPVVLLHTLYNFSSDSIWIFADEYVTYAEEWWMLSFPILIAAIGIWAWYIHRKNKKA